MHLNFPTTISIINIFLFHWHYQPPPTNRLVKKKKFKWQLMQNNLHYTSSELCHMSVGGLLFFSPSIRPNLNKAALTEDKNAFTGEVYSSGHLLSMHIFIWKTPACMVCDAKSWFDLIMGHQPLQYLSNHYALVKMHAQALRNTHTSSSFNILMRLISALTCLQHVY